MNNKYLIIAIVLAGIAWLIINDQDNKITALHRDLATSNIELARAKEALSRQNAAMVKFREDMKDAKANADRHIADIEKRYSDEEREIIIVLEKDNSCEAELRLINTMLSGFLP